MPQYTFRVAGEASGELLNFPNDQAAWSEVVKWCGQMLLDEDGSLQDGAEIELLVLRESGNRMGTIKVVASRSPAESM